MYATFGGLTFVGDGGAATYTIGRNGLTGWFEGVETQGEQVARQGADGGFDSPLYLGSRLITLNGLVRASSESGFEAALMGLAALPTRALSTFTVTSDAGATSAQVRRVGKPDISVNHFGLSGSYQVQLLAPDPRRYGASNSFGPSTSVAVSHAGNYDARPTIAVTGTMGSGYTISNGSVSYTVTLALAAGHTHTIDLATGWLYLDGVLQTGAVSSAQTWVVPAGVTVTHTLTPVAGSGSMTVTVSDTYC